MRVSRPGTCASSAAPARPGDPGTDTCTMGFEYMLRATRGWCVAAQRIFAPVSSPSPPPPPRFRLSVFPLPVAWWLFSFFSCLPLPSFAFSFTCLADAVAAASTVRRFPLLLAGCAFSLSCVLACVCKVESFRSSFFFSSGYRFRHHRPLTRLERGIAFSLLNSPCCPVLL